MGTNLQQLCIDTIRTLSMDAVQAANSGHPGTPMALAPVAYAIYDGFMKFNPSDPDWLNRDRFILSAGHASMLLYGTLHVMGYDIPIGDIRLFRQLHSKCPGHPEYRHTPGVETTTGPLGQGVANSVGFAIAEKWLAARFNKPGYDLVDYKIFAIAGDGCMMEGISSEAASLAGHLGLNNLVWIFDNNHITIEGNTNLAFTENVGARFVAYGWNVFHVTDANDLDMIGKALALTEKEKEKPSLIILDSHIAWGAPTKQDTHGAHGSPLGEEEIRGAKLFYGLDPDKKFFVPDEVKAFSKEIAARGKKQQEEWNGLYSRYRAEYPELAAELDMIQNRELPAGWDQSIPVFEPGTKISGRAASGKVLNAISANIPFLIGGSADLSPSTLTDIKNGGSFQKDNFGGRNIHYGIRENAMGAIANGIALSGLKTFVSTFFVFSDYARPSIRLSAMMGLPVVYVFTHDSIGVGEDGPTHQPVEQLASLRAMPGLDVIRPADAGEVAVLWRHIMESKHNPTALILSRQDLPVIDRTKYAPAADALKGAYILADCAETPEIILIATGSEIQLALDAFEALKQEGIKARVVSMPAWNLFEKQSPAYRESVLPSGVRRRISIEAGSTFGWEKFIGLPGDGLAIGMTTFGASGKPDGLMKEFGLTVDAVLKAAKSIIKNV